MSFSPRQLHVVTAISNPLLYASRFRLTHEWLHRMLDAGVNVTIVEVTQGERQSECLKIRQKLADTFLDAHERVNVIHLRTRDVLWVKESLLNIGVSSLPDNWRYMAWIDADVEFQREDWAVKTLQALQVHDVVQMFQNVVDLGPNGEMVGEKFHSFAYSWRKKIVSPNGRYNDRNFHPGFCWAWRREAYEAVGGFIDYAILGSADRYMAAGLVGIAHTSIPAGYSDAYKNRIMGWQARAMAHIHENVGFVPGMLKHYWHGPKKGRQYEVRDHILINRKYSPDTDIDRNWAKRGLVEWAHHATRRQRLLRNEVLDYFGQRNEDSIDLH